MTDRPAASLVEPLGIGERLRNAREARGWSLQAVADITRIRPVYLQALEDEQFDRLPGAVYTKGFLRTYAGALGLDPGMLMEAYPQAFETPDSSLIGMHPVEIPIRPAAPRSRTRVVVTYAAVLLGFALVAIGIIGYLQLRQFSEPVPPPQASPPPPAAQPAPPEPPAAPLPPEPASPQPEVPADHAQPLEVPTRPVPQFAEPAPPTPALAASVQLEVRARGTSWLRVTVDGERVFQGLMHDGETRLWQAKRRLTLRVGNSSAVQVVVNGRTVPAPSGARVWEHTFTAQ